MTIKFSEITEITYDLNDIEALKEKGATSIEVIQFAYNGVIVSGIIGVKDGVRMANHNSLVALPCPPFCDGGDNISLSRVLAEFKSS